MITCHVIDGLRVLHLPRNCITGKEKNETPTISSMQYTMQLVRTRSIYITKDSLSE